MIQALFNLLLLLLGIGCIIAWITSLVNYDGKCHYEECEQCPYEGDCPMEERRENERDD